ncbi:MAG: CDP-diacylglycerol--glycerol-3-phosphate 3-phosphatidyltransferase [Firmicutes bacterium]|nr:CDP-diacylglycerol--glycerol-3-phosphate 3-phosphatidyltransferase [Bacillota bacterium]
MSKIPLNLPNRITIARILLIPVHLALLSIGAETCRYAAAVVFAIAALTDTLDGVIARRYDLVTDFGKFMDPIADKLLVLLPFILLAVRDGGSLNMWAVMVMVGREIVVNGFRLAASTRGTVIAADWPGKLKTIVQMLSVLALSAGLPFGWPLAWAAAVLSVYSGIAMIARHRVVLEEGA